MASIHQLHLGYLGLPVQLIEDQEDFYRSGIKEASKIRNLISVCRRIFITNTKNIQLYLVGEKDIYRLDVWDNKKYVARIYYLPKEYRLDIFDGADPDSPMFMWKNKKCLYKNIPICLDVVKAESVFLPLISVT